MVERVFKVDLQIPKSILKNPALKSEMDSAVKAALKHADDYNEHNFAQGLLICAEFDSEAAAKACEQFVDAAIKRLSRESNKMTLEPSQIQALEKLCLELNVTAESMDDFIHEQLSVTASAINNAGMTDQLRFIALSGHANRIEEKFNDHGLAFDLKAYIDSAGYEAMAGALEAMGVECSDLDDIVHDCEGEAASIANNGGIAGQIAALAERIGYNETEKLLRSRFGTAANGVTP